MKPSAPRKAPSFLSGVSLLTLSALTVKVIGLCYRIPLLGYLGTEGMGYFNTAYELYALFCVISTAGLPVAMSVLISAAEAEGRRGDARGIFRVSLLLFAGIGLVGTGLLWGLSSPLAALLGSPLSAVCMRAISPTLFLICLSSAFRGYFQGQRNMLPTALSQVIEAGGKLFLGLAFAACAYRMGKDLPTCAAYAVLGLTAGTAISLLYLFLHQRMAGQGESLLPSVTKSPVLRPLLATAIPVTVSAGMISLTKCVDLALILRRLQTVGYTAAEANALYGCYSTLAVPVFNILPSLTTSVALSAVPALSAAFRKGEAGREELGKTARASFELTMAFSIPAALGLAVFAKDILSLLFSGQSEAVAQAAPWLSCLGLSVPAACLITVTGSMLQAAGMANRSMISMLAGVVVKTGLAFILLGQEGWGMAGAPVSSLACDTVIVAVNLFFIARHAPAMLPRPLDGMRLVCVPAALAVGAVSLTKLLRRMGGWEEIAPWHTVAAIACVACLYGAGILLRFAPAYISKQKKKDLQYDQVNQRSP